MKLRASLSLLAASAGIALAGPHAAPPDGPVPGAALLVVSDKADTTYCGGRKVTVRARSRRGDRLEPELVAAMTIDGLHGLDLDPAHAGAPQASRKKVLAWFTDASKKMSAARALYTGRATDTKTSAADKVVALARIVQLERRFADVIARMEIPVGERTGQYAAEKVAEICDALAEKAQPFYERAADDAATCRKAAAAAKLGAGWWDTACAP